jgi:hypothetical protein
MARAITNMTVTIKFRRRTAFIDLPRKIASVKYAKNWDFEVIRLRRETNYILGTKKNPEITENDPKSQEDGPNFITPVSTAR